MLIFFKPEHCLKFHALLNMQEVIMLPSSSLNQIPYWMRDFVYRELRPHNTLELRAELPEECREILHEFWAMETDPEKVINKDIHLPFYYLLKEGEDIQKLFYVDNKVEIAPHTISILTTCRELLDKLPRSADFNTLYSVFSDRKLTYCKSKKRPHAIVLMNMDYKKINTDYFYGPTVGIFEVKFLTDTPIA